MDWIFLWPSFNDNYQLHSVPVQGVFGLTFPGPWGLGRWCSPSKGLDIVDIFGRILCTFIPLQNYPTIMVSLDNDYN